MYNFTYNKYSFECFLQSCHSLQFVYNNILTGIGLYPSIAVVKYSKSAQKQGIFIPSSY